MQKIIVLIDAILFHAYFLIFAASVVFIIYWITLLPSLNDSFIDRYFVLMLNCFIYNILAALLIIDNRRRAYVGNVARGGYLIGAANLWINLILSYLLFNRGLSDPVHATISIMGFEWSIITSQGVYLWTFYGVAFSPLGLLVNIDGPQFDIFQLNSLYLAMIASSIIGFNNSIYDFITIYAGHIFTRTE